MSLDLSKDHAVIGGASVAKYFQDGVYYTHTGLVVPDEIAAMDAAEGTAAFEKHLKQLESTSKVRQRTLASTAKVPPQVPQQAQESGGGDEGTDKGTETEVYNGPEGDEEGADPAAEKPTAPTGNKDPEQRESYRTQLMQMQYASLKKAALDAGMPADEVPTGEGAKDKLAEWLLDNTEY